MTEQLVRATKVVVGGAVSAPVADRVVLDYEGRRKRRMVMRGQGGLSFLLDLVEAPTLDSGDYLVLEDERLVEVEAACEALAEITCQDSLLLMRIAYHLGNRHLAVEIAADRIQIRADHVIEQMVRRFGASVRRVSAPFSPESGAYGPSGHSHEHS